MHEIFCMCLLLTAITRSVKICEHTQLAFVSAPIFYIIIGKIWGAETSGKYDFLLIVFRLCGGSEAQIFLNSLLEYRHNYYWSLRTAYAQLVLMQLLLIKPVSFPHTDSPRQAKRQV
jgi:hypothetical protein